MRQRIFYLGIPVFLGILGAGLLLLLLINSPLPQMVQERVTKDSPDPVILARDPISITIGIDDSLALRNTNLVLVSGHGVCGSGGDAYRISVQVTQDGVSAPAVGHTDAECLGDEPASWQADAVLPAGHTFQQGPAQVCTMAVIHYTRAGAIVYQGCRDVLIE